MSARYIKDLDVPDFTINVTPVRTSSVTTGNIFGLKDPVGQNQKLKHLTGLSHSKLSLL